MIKISTSTNDAAGPKSQEPPPSSVQLYGISKFWCISYICYLRIPNLTENVQVVLPRFSFVTNSRKTRVDYAKQTSCGTSWRSTSLVSFYWHYYLHSHNVFLAGLFSGMASHVMTSRFIYPRMIRRMTAEAKVTVKPPTTGGPAAGTAGTTQTILPSLGASGAIYSAVALTAMAFPHTEIALMIPPSFPIPIQWGVGALVVVDIVGALRGWRCVR